MLVCYGLKNAKISLFSTPLLKNNRYEVNVKNSMVLVMCIFFLLILTGCGTVKGMGQDISAAGDWLEKTSDQVKKK
mgnify:CR=1 FL=1